MKRKFSLILNISSLCITIASIIIGVYALQQASLSLKGSVGFVAHNSNVVVTPYITGYDGTESTSVMQTRAEQEALELGGPNGEMVGKLTLHNLNFNDMKTDGNTIIIELHIENKSAFDVELTLNMPTLTQSDGVTPITDSVVTITVTNGTEKLTETNNKVLLKDKTNSAKETTITIKLFANDLKSIDESILKGAQIAASVSFDQFTPVTSISYLAVNWQPLIFTDEGTNANGFCTTGNTTSLEFTDVIPTDSNLIKNSDNTVKTIPVGANELDTERTSDTTITAENVKDVIAYAIKYSNSSYKIILYSPGKIYIGNKGYSDSASMYTKATSSTFRNTDNIRFMLPETPEFKLNDGNQFSCLSYLTDITFNNADFSKVTNAYRMFYFGGYTTLDLSNFDTSNVTNMKNMFGYCKRLTTIIVDTSKWVTTNVTLSDGMFYNCTKLVGGDGTVYKVSNVDVKYAKVGNGGYLTSK